MSDFRHRMLAMIVVALVVGAGTVSAEEPPEEEELSETEEEGDEDEQEPDEDGEVAEEEDGDDAVDEEEPEERPDDWETSLRDRISPVMNDEGAVGFHGIASAKSPGTMNFQVGLFGRATGGSDFIRYNDEHGGWTGSVLFNGWFNEYFGVHFRTQARNSVNTFGRPEAMLSQGDTSLGATARYPVSDGISLGGDLGFFVPTEFGNVSFNPGSTSIRPRALMTFDFDEIAGERDDMYVPLVAHANIGYRFDNSENTVQEGVRIDRLERHAYGVSAYDGVEMGLGLEAPLPYVTPFLGWNLDIPVNASGDVCGDDRPLACVEDVGASSFPQKMSIGAKTEPIDNLGLHAGMDIGLTAEQAEGVPPTIPYEFNFGVSWNIDPSAQAEPVDLEIEYADPERGSIEGLVLDGETGDPVEEVRISYADNDLPDQLSGEESGLFQTYEFLIGSEVEMQLEHPDYEPQQVRHQLDEAGDRLEVAMEPLPDPGVLRGTVLDTEGEPVGGVSLEVRSDDGEQTRLETDDQGRFEGEVEGSGTMRVVAAHDNFLATGDQLELERGGEADIDVAMRAVDEWRAEVTDTEIITEGDIEFETDGTTPRDESGELLDQIAALLLEHGDIETLEIQGHTDDQGEDDELAVLSQERADAVREALAERGIDPDRLETEGYGATQPMVPNTSSRNRTLNERIEFHIVD